MSIVLGLTCVFLSGVFQIPLSAQAVKDREGAVRNDRAALEKDTRWVYNDWEAGLFEGKESGKPVLIILRCVPCLGCGGIDAQVLLQDQGLKELMSKFVCVRVINANALDLSRFQFDYDLSFSALFFNGDGTLYGRFGSWAHQKNAQDKSTEGFRKALEGALALHAAYPTNRSTLVGKLGAPSPYKRTVDIPTFAGKYKLALDWNGKVVPSCVHCHQIGDALRLEVRNRGEKMPENLIYPWPEPITVGFTIVPGSETKVESVVPGSSVAKAGLLAGDEIIAMNGQPIISTADISWILQQAPAAGPISLVIRQAGSEKSRTISFDLSPGWRSKSDIARRVGTWGLRGMATGGLVLEDVTDEQRKQRGLGPNDLALLVKYVGEYGRHGASKKAGFLKDDVIVNLEGISGHRSEGEVLGMLLQSTRPGDKVRTTVLRGTERVTLQLPMQ